MTLGFPAIWRSAANTSGKAIRVHIHCPYPLIAVAALIDFAKQTALVVQQLPMIADHHHLAATILDCFTSPVSFLRHIKRFMVVYEECGCQRIGGRSKRSDLAAGRQIMASSSEKVQVDPMASNKKKPPPGGLTTGRCWTLPATASRSCSIQAQTNSLAHGDGAFGLIIKCRKAAPITEQKRGRLVRGYWLNISKRR